MVNTKLTTPFCFKRRVSINSVLSLLFLFIPGIFSCISAQDKSRSIAIWDIDSLTGTTSIQAKHAVSHLLSVSGLPYVITTNLDTAISYGTIITTPPQGSAHLR